MFYICKIYSLLLVLIPVGCSDHAKDSSFIPMDIEELEAFVADVYHAYPLPGLTVGVVTADTSLFISMGYADVEAEKPLEDNTVFFAGGFSELLVATGALALQETGDLALHDQVVTRLPYFQTKGAYDRISIHHLLTHTSGIPHFNPAWDMPTHEADALEGITRSIIFQELEATPGSRCKRSPYNFDIAADLLAKTAQQSFEQVMRQSVLEPLGMVASGFSPREFSEERLAQPHQIDNWLKYSVATQEMYPYTRENAGSYGLHTTVKDLAKWMKMVLKNDGSELLSPASIEELLRLHYQTDEQTYKGYGWDIVKSDEELIYNNSWSTGGFSGDMSLFPGRQLGIVVVSNTSDDFNPTIISEHIAHLLHGGALEKVKVPAHIAMSRQLAGGKSIEETLTWYDSLMAVDNPPYLLKPALLGQLGVNLLHRLSRKEDALKVFHYCVKKYPDSAEAHLNLVEGLLAFGHIDDAKAHFNTALSLGECNSPYVNFLREQLDVAMENKVSS